LSQSNLPIHITDFIAKLIAQIAKSLQIPILPSFPLLQQVPNDERIAIVAMELFCKAKQRHGRFEENLNASADAIHSKISASQGGVSALSTASHSLVAVLYEHDSILTVNPFFVFATMEPWFRPVFFGAYLS